ncbi:MAG: hypothetical protein JSS27_11865 [Planctomycetes bacterium]|nr:hypothetical protein [Planctomycetota bacterium]
MATIISLTVLVGIFAAAYVLISKRQRGKRSDGDSYGFQAPGPDSYPGP